MMMLTVELDILGSVKGSRFHCSCAGPQGETETTRSIANRKPVNERELSTDEYNLRMDPKITRARN